ncbi:MAG: NUDIX hydrolase [Patescibacteria group bacterium]|jgi:ADP-ribose pyrophosphatase
MRTNIKLPKGGKRVFHGDIFDVYQWPQKMYDGSTHPFEIVARPDTALIIALTDDHKVLIQREFQPQHKKPFISIPGGRVDDDEQPLAAAKRELREETGYTAKKWTLFKKSRFTSKINWDMYIYIAYACKKTHTPHLDAGERITTFRKSVKEFFSMIEKEKLAEPVLLMELLKAKADKKKMTALKKLLTI